MHHQGPFVLLRSYVCEFQIHTKKQFLKFCTEALEHSSMESESTVFRRHLKTRLFFIRVLVSLVAALAGTPLPPFYFFFYFRCTFLLFPVSFLTTLLCRAVSPWYNRNCWLGVKHQLTYCGVSKTCTWTPTDSVLQVQSHYHHQMVYILWSWSGLVSHTRARQNRWEMQLLHQHGAIGKEGLATKTEELVS